MTRLKLSRWLLLVTATAMVPLLAVLFYNLYVLHTSRESEAHREAARSGQLVALELQRIVTGIENVMIAVSSAPVVRLGDTGQCSEFLAKVANRLDGVATIGVIDTNGLIKCRQDRQGLGVSLADRPYFQAALKSSDVVVGEYTKSRITGKALLPMALSFRNDQGTVIGVIATSIDLDWLQRLIATRELPKGGAITVADKNGIILARFPQPEKFVGSPIPEQYRYLVHADAPGTLELTSQDGTRRIVAYLPVNAMPHGLYVSTGLSIDDTFATIRRATSLSVLASLLTLLLSLYLSLQISRYAVARPVNRILAAVRAWKRDDLSARTGLTGEDEFGTIGAAFDGLVEQLVAARQRNDLIMAELDHRVKNGFALVQSIARQSFRDEPLSRQAQDRFSDRLRAVALTFSSLKEGDWRTVGLEKLVEQSIAPFDDGGNSQCAVAGPPVNVNSRAALALGMTLHELATNAVKYGALSTHAGRVSITWDVSKEPDALLRITWAETGGPRVSKPERTGFGTSMIQRALTAQFGGEVDLDYRPEGVFCLVTLPMRNLAEDDMPTPVGGPG